MMNRILSVLLLFFLSGFPPASAREAKRPDPVTGTPILWKAPHDIASRDLLTGPLGGLKPQAPFVFIQEDSSGTNPKFMVRDGNGVEWQVKIGVEARPEVAASRLLWAAGFFVNECHFLPTLRVEKLPELKRGKELLGPDGLFHGVRFKRALAGEKVDDWSWHENPFVGTREFNGLRVMMALINNWDLKTVNNAVIRRSGANGSESGDIYMVSDLGSSFGSNHWIRPLDHAKGNLASFKKSVFVDRIADGHVDFKIATRPAIINAVNLPLYLKYLGMDRIGKRIPLEDARWVGQLLSSLSRQQIEDVFRGAGFESHEVEGFADILLDRIAELRDL